jgi:hypothetical protein
MNGRLYLYTGRRCVRPPAAGNDVELTQWARDQGVNYFLFMAGDGGMVARAGDAARFPQEVMANALAHSALFKPVYVDRVERAAIFRVQRTISDP